ncbi:MAG: ABC transporter ATP-binding protein [Chitinophagaceae bacterium]
MQSLKRLIPFARPLHHFFPEYIVYTVGGILFGLLNFTLLIPILQLLFDQEMVMAVSKPAFSLSLDFAKDYFNYVFSTLITEKGKFHALLMVSACVGVSIVLANIFRYLSLRVILRLRLKLIEGLRNQLYEKLLQQSLSYHHQQTKGELLMVMTTEVQEMEGSVVNSLQILLRDPFVVLAYFSILFYWSPKLTLFTLVFLPITGIIISSITRKLKRLNYYSQEMMSRIMSQTDESIGGIRQIQSFGAEAMMKKVFYKMNRDFSQHSKALAGKKELASPISEVLGMLAALTLIVFGGYLILHGETSMTGSGFIAYLALYTQIIQPLKNLSHTSSVLQRGIVACERIFKTIDTPITITNTEHAIRKTSFDDKLTLQNLSFGYGEEEVLKNIHLTIEKGKTIALVGQSGSGKSTLADLISRFYDADQGALLMDGVDIKQISIEDLRGLIGIVSQESFLFNDTVMNNIALGKPGASEESIIAAAKVANAHSFIMELENGYHTITGERGVKLSGGQRQRIAIARALLKNAPILILDEATSAMET